MKTGRFHALWIAASLAFAPSPGPADAIGDLEDAAARIQYAFHTADVRGIEQALAALGSLELPESRKGMKEYYTAYAHWKLAELHSASVAAGNRAARGEAVRAAAACEKAADSATALSPRLAEAHAFQAICAAQASRAPNVLSLGSCVRHKGLRNARELEPENPRVRLIEAQCMLQEDKDAAGMLVRVQAIVRDFETAPPAAPGQPDWGYAEASLLLGRLLLQQGDRIAARDAVERALVIAPDYRAARELLQQISSANLPQARHD